MAETFVILNADGALARQPFAVACSGDIGDGPAAVRLLGRDLVLWRSPGGNIIAAPDLCTHSRGILSHGQVTEGRLVCPKHGWTFGDEGRCVAKPSNMPITEKAHLKTYPCTERYGLIWVSLGDPAAPVIDIAWDGDERYRRTHTGVSVWRSNPIQIIEALLAEADSPSADITAEVPFCVRETLRPMGGGRHHRLLSCTPIDGRTSLVTSVIWSSRDDDDTKITDIATADLAELKSVSEAGGMRSPIVEISDQEDTVLTDWKRRLVALVAP
ncbi:Rieske 2Fe-2S domain-containing protein [Mycobacterium sp. SMC-2]|uniref:Rieske 2Fe-2S domain-containing protein n=1 Tax=Mycobacterium sp. SMC-2 TaxID=2857058 RepID=UPI0021B28DAE|nr:Rieske 2Fe-2S domain-containing protein [Mycobacterium sp. SMC-2]UXA06165.1 Rieske 2Fe-2S domain-containing protein [Mycobacterium sp. SMC-2]